MRERASHGEIALYCLDEAGFALRLVVPYAWQPFSERLCLKQTGGRQLNVLGLMRPFSEGAADVVHLLIDAPVNSDIIVACLDYFTARFQGLVIVVLDNAPRTPSATFEQARPRWK